MNEAARKALNAYNRKWRAENKDRVKEYNRRYWEKKAKAENENTAEIVNAAETEEN